ncbi:hypothetical protein NBRC116495_23820 [Aurantivibrio plasticivorans]
MIFYHLKHITPTPIFTLKQDETTAAQEGFTMLVATAFALYFTLLGWVAYEDLNLGGQASFKA